MSDERYFVEVQHRPRRVAFLVDVGQSSDSLFDEIVEFNVSSWGGRHNPIIPVVGGQISDSYWKLLGIANADIVYAYCDLPAALLKKIMTEIRPLNVLRHKPSFSPEGDGFSVKIDRQATVVPVLNRMMNQFPVWARQPEPATMVFDYKSISALSSFVRRNFGGNHNYYFYCRDHQIPSETLPPDDKEVMKALASNRNLVLPIHICADAPRKFKASTSDHGAALTLCYGSSPWDFIEYWNLAHFIGEVRSVAQSLSEMWIKPALLEDTSFYNSFLELIRRRVFVSEHGNHLRLISYSETEEQMREVTMRICTDYKWNNIYPADPIVRKQGELPDFEPRAVISMFRTDQPTGKQVSGNTPFLEISPSTDAPSGQDERWIAELAVENPEQERFFANKTAWWKLPLKGGLANLFVPHSPCRVGNDCRINVEVSGQQRGIMLNTPKLESLFAALVLPKAPPVWTQRLDSTILSRFGQSFYIQASDKGKYARGVLGLFESLQKAAFVFEHDYWRGVIESLSSPVASVHTRNKVRADFERIGTEAFKSASGLDLIVDEVLDAAGRIQRPVHYANFDALFARYWAYLKTLPKEEQIHEVTQTNPSRPDFSDEKSMRETASTNLRDMISEMTARELFLHGAEIRCDHCLATLWYHVDDLRSRVTCRGCRKKLNLPAEARWSYALNELVVSAVRDHGVAPVIRTASRLFEGSRECFCFLPGIEIRDYSTDPQTQICELDLVWIRDGEFGIAEIKRSPKKFSVGEKLASILEAALPDRFLLVCSSGNASQMQEILAGVQARVGPNTTVEAWSPEIFARSPDIGWNTFRYTILG
jgi:hypothetical protein